MKRLLALLLFVPSLLMAQVPDHVPTEGLVAWYPFYQSLEEVVGGHDGQSVHQLLKQAVGSFSKLATLLSICLNHSRSMTWMGASPRRWIRLDDSDMVWRVVMDLTDGDEDNSRDESRYTFHGKSSRRIALGHRTEDG